MTILLAILFNTTLTILICALLRGAKRYAAELPTDTFDDIEYVGIEEDVDE